ncbi:MAG: hypothetical protein WA988_14180 [Candidatus Nanopelagicales bacterium]
MSRLLSILAPPNASSGHYNGLSSEVVVGANAWQRGVKSHAKNGFLGP